MINKTLLTKSLSIITCTAVVLSGCAVNDAGKASSSSIKPAEEKPAIVIEEKEPAMVINKDEPEIEPEEETNEPEGFHGYILSPEEENDPRVKCIETKEEGSVLLSFAGDINFDEGYSNMNNYRSAGNGIYGVMSENLIERMNSADIFMINNEFPYSLRGTPTANKRFTFRVKPEHVNDMLNMGVDIVSLANNHAYDYGEEALLDTFETLTSADIPYVGAGKDISEAAAPFYFIAGGMKIAYVSATQIERTDPPDTKEATETSPGVLRTLDPARFVKTIEEAEENADFTVVYVHWGSENTYDVEQSQRDLANAYINAGADLIIGDHSHCLEGFEYINNVPIIYSMGNFWFSSKDLDSGLVEAKITKDGIEYVKYVPCVQHNCRTDMYEKGDSEYDRLLGVMSYLSYDVSIDEDGIISPGKGHGVEDVTPKPLKKASYQLSPEEQAAALLNSMSAEPEGEAP